MKRLKKQRQHLLGLITLMRETGHVNLELLADYDELNRIINELEAEEKQL